MAEETRRRYPHQEDAQNFILVDIGTDKRVWVNLTRVFKIEAIESGGMFGFRFFSPALAVTPGMEQHFFSFDSALIYNNIEELTESAKALFWNFPGSIGVVEP